MNSDAVTIGQAARELNRNPATIRKWIAQGAPTESLGTIGRGNGSLVNVEAMKRWRYGTAEASGVAEVQRLCETLRGVMQRNAVHAEAPLHEAFGLKRHLVALVLIEVYQRHALQLQGAVPDTPPEFIQTMTAIVAEETARKCAILAR